MNNPSPRSQRGWSARLATLAFPLLALPVIAQQANTPAEETVKLEKFVVTGSYIPIAADSIANPVTTITAEEISRTGVTTNALDVLRKAVPQFTGNANIGSENANINSSATGGGSQASLRNLTTLTLINGRRAAVSPISGTGGNQFVDLNIIPMAAIENIEILLDGASATYGSDATSGVINIKTKNDFSGVALSGFYEWTDQKGGWANRGGNFVLGSGNGKTSLTVAGGWSKQDPLWQHERSYSSPQYGTPTFGGVINIGSNYFVLNPALNAPPVGATKPTLNFPMTSSPLAPNGNPYFGAVGSNAVYWGKVVNGQIVGFGAGELAGATSPDAEQVAFDLSNYVTILQRREQRGAITTFNHEFNDAVQFFGDLIVAQTRTFSQINAQPVGTTPSFNVSGSHPFNPFNTTLRVRNRFVASPRQYFYNTDFARSVMGFRGEINDRLSYETAVNLNRSDLAYKNPGVIDSAGLLAAAGITPLATSQAGVALNLFQRNIPGSAVAAANFIGTGYNDFSSALRSWDGRIVYRALEWAAGDVVLAIGGEHRMETLEGTADLNSIPDPETGAIGWTGATSVNPFSADRDVTGMFLEASIPLAGPNQNLSWAHALDLGVAVRHEKYSDTDDPTVPKVTLRWLPFNDEFAIRGTYSESFNAPTLYNLFGPSNIGFTPSVTLLPHGAADQPGNYVAGQSQWRTSSNPALLPAESEASTVGFVWSPKRYKGLTVELNYYQIAETNVVSLVNPQTILQSVETLGTASPYLARNAGPNNPVGNFINPRTGRAYYDVAIEGFRGNGTPITAPGQVANNIDSIYVDQPQVNFASQSTSGYDFKARYKWDVRSVGLLDLSTSVAYVYDYNINGEEVGSRATVTGGTIPRWQSYTQLAWQRGNWDAYLANRFVPATNAPDEASSGKTEAEQYSEWDLGFSYRFDGKVAPWLKGLRLSLIVNNVGNEKPAQLPDTFSNDSVDTGTYDPIGRRFVVSAEYRF